MAPDDCGEISGTGRCSISSLRERLNAELNLGETSIPGLQLMELPDDIFYHIFSFQTFHQLLKMRLLHWKFHHLIDGFHIIRLRALRCIHLDKQFPAVELGFGVSVGDPKRILSEAQVSSDFELVSREAFVEWLVRESTKGNPFQRWIPLPITQPHWASVKKHLPILVEDFQKRRTTQTSPSFCIVAKLMYKVLARLATNNLYNREPRKAFLKYFALAHLLFCLAIEEEGVLSAAEDAIKQFRAGVKVNLAYVQAASLLSREGLTPTLLKEMIEEAIHRGIPSMLKSRPELALFEASAVSPFRNRATAHWIQRRMMIRLVAKLFHEFIRPDLNEPLAVIVKRMFDQYGAPSAREMVEMGNPVRKIILSCAEELLTKFHFDWFPLNDRGDIHGPFPQDIIWESDKVTAFFRDNITQSIEKGYCQMPITQPEALCLRLKIEDYVEIAQDLKPADEPPPKSMLNFQTKDEAEEGPDLEESERRAVWLKHGKAHSHPFPAKNVA